MVRFTGNFNLGKQRYGELGPNPLQGILLGTSRDYVGFRV